MAISGEGPAALALLRERMNRLFDEGDEARLAAPFAPPTDVYTTAAEVVVSIELPGVRLADLNIQIDGGQLLVHGQRAFRDGPVTHHLERHFGELRCQVALPPDARPERRQTELEEGVLTIAIPRGSVHP
jgi:HSP20 family protein